MSDPYLSKNMDWNDDAQRWEPAQPIGWLEEHSWLQRLVYKVRGVGHCGKKGWRE